MWILSYWWFWIFVGLIVVFYRWSISSFGFFDRLGVAYRKPWPIVGNLGASLLRRKTLLEILSETYKEFENNKCFGFFRFGRPMLVLVDPDLIRQVLVKDFNHFVDHRDLILNEDIEPLLGKSLFMLKGQKWRDMRSTLSPAFTGIKLRTMFHLIVNTADQAMRILHEQCAVDRSGSFEPELKDLFMRCASDVIASTAFGIEIDSLKDRTNKFYMIGQRSISFRFKDLIVALIMGYFPKVSNYFGLQFFDAEQTEFYRSLVLDTMQHREKHNVVRPDMIQLLMAARKGTLKHDGVSSNVNGEGFAVQNDAATSSIASGIKRVWSDSDLTAQCFLFFIAGFETSSLSMSVTAQELAENPVVQEKLRAEVDEVNATLQGEQLTYDALQSMKYMDMVISESLRKWPPAFLTDRVCTEPYELRIDESVIRLEKGYAVWIPINAIHRDERHYTKPENFDPERFSEENKHLIKSNTFLPFSTGPRSCIGSRFALMEVKAFIFYMLKTFTLEVTDRTQIPLRLLQTGFSVRAEKGFNIRLIPRS